MASENDNRPKKPARPRRPHPAAAGEKPAGAAASAPTPDAPAAGAAPADNAGSAGLNSAAASAMKVLASAGKLFIAGTRSVAVPLAAGYSRIPDGDADELRKQDEEAERSGQTFDDSLRPSESAQLKRAAQKMVLELGQTVQANFPVLPEGQTIDLSLDERGRYGEVSSLYLLSAIKAARSFLDARAQKQAADAQAQKDAQAAADAAAARGPTNVRVLRARAQQQRQAAGVATYEYQAPPQVYEVATPRSGGGAKILNLKRTSMGVRYMKSGSTLAKVATSAGTATKKSGCGCGGGGQARATTAAGRWVAVSPAAAGGCGCGCGGAGGTTAVAVAPSSGSATTETACTALTMSCTTKESLVNCLKSAICDFLRCAEDVFCATGKFQVPQNGAGQALLDCLGTTACSIIKCVPDALCPEPPSCLPEVPADDGCDFAVEEPA